MFDQLNREKWKETEAKKSAHHAINPIAQSVHIVAGRALNGKSSLVCALEGLGLNSTLAIVKHWCVVNVSSFGLSPEHPFIVFRLSKSARREFF